MLGLRILALGVCALALAACFETRDEVFPPEAAAAVAGLEGHYRTQRNEYVVTKMADGGDYAFRDLEYPSDSPGRLRAVRVAEDIYVAQLRVEDWKPGVNWQLLFRVERKDNAIVRIVQLEPDSDAAHELAGRSGVSINASDNGPQDPNVLSGTPAALAGFLKALANVPLREAGTYTRVD